MVIDKVGDMGDSLMNLVSRDSYVLATAVQNTLDEHQKLGQQDFEIEIRLWRFVSRFDGHLRKKPFDIPLLLTL